MKELELPDVLSAAARATINEQAGMAYVHDVRGTMQALFGAFELLARSARSGSDPTRVEKACDLAKRAISNHEKSTIGVLELLTSRSAEPAAVNVGTMVTEVAHFLRQTASMKDIKVLVSATADLYVETEPAKLQTLLVGLVSEAIEETPEAGELRLTAERRDDEAVISIGSALGYETVEQLKERADRLPNKMRPRDLTLMFARHFLLANGGRLDIDSAGIRGTLSLVYPLLVNA